jgi:hypothetical protein
MKNSKFHSGLKPTAVRGLWFKETLTLTSQPKALLNKTVYQKKKMCLNCKVNTVGMFEDK